MGARQACLRQERDQREKASRERGAGPHFWRRRGRDADCAAGFWGEGRAAMGARAPSPLFFPLEHLRPHPGAGSGEGRLPVFPPRPSPIRVYLYSAAHAARLLDNLLPGFFRLARCDLRRAAVQRGPAIRPRQRRPRAACVMNQRTEMPSQCANEQPASGGGGALPTRLPISSHPSSQPHHNCTLLARSLHAIRSQRLSAPAPAIGEQARQPILRSACLPALSPRPRAHTAVASGSRPLSLGFP